MAEQQERHRVGVPGAMLVLLCVTLALGSLGFHPDGLRDLPRPAPSLVAVPAPSGVVGRGLGHGSDRWRTEGAALPDLAEMPTPDDDATLLAPCHGVAAVSDGRAVAVGRVVSLPPYLPSSLHIHGPPRSVASPRAFALA